ncbi:MAG TPA: hypothetical protein VGP70_28805 [Actinomadura sp.]|nr:hypothetical protein [Actinomadura sp.]
MHPDDVNVGSGGSTDGQEAFKQFCLGQANSRLWESAVTLLVGFLLASGCGFVAAVDQRRTT